MRGSYPAERRDVDFGRVEPALLTRLDHRYSTPDVHKVVALKGKMLKQNCPWNPLLNDSLLSRNRTSHYGEDFVRLLKLG